MTKKEFSSLSLLERKILLLKKGKHLMAREAGAYRVYLFGLEEKYVELYYHQESNQLLWIEIQDNKSILDEYLKEIQLPDWLK